MPRHKFFQLTLSLLNVLIKKNMGKTKKKMSQRGKIPKIELGYTLAKLRLRLRKGSNKDFFSMKVPDLVQRPTAPTVAGKNP